MRMSVSQKPGFFEGSGVGRNARIALFWLVCIPVRISIGVAILLVPDLLSLILLVASFLALIFYSSRGVGDDLVWWSRTWQSFFTTMLFFTTLLYPLFNATKFILFVVWCVDVVMGLIQFMVEYNDGSI